ncbi:MAG: patatin-like phospholipase family protein [Candidatus Manganitrophaceae bacterium]
MHKYFKLGLALGGGGARGIAHLGVLNVLEAEGIECNMIAGTSFGAIAGAMYAQHPNAAEVRRKVCSYLDSAEFRRTKLFFIKRHYEEEKRSSFINNLKSYLQKGIFWGISLRRSSFISEQDYVYHIGRLFEEKGVEETVIPFIAVAADLAGGNPVVLSQGPIRRVIAATCAIPGVFPPIEIGDAKLIDGGWVNQVPVEPLIHRGIDFVIAVDASEEGIARKGREFSSGLDIVLRAGEITRRVLSAAQLAQADIVIRPDVGGLHWSDFWRAEEAIQKGEEAAREKIQELKHLLWKKKIKKMLLMKI